LIGLPVEVAWDAPAGIRAADDPDRAAVAVDGDQAALGLRPETLEREVSDSLDFGADRRLGSSPAP
jgi:hypothetical protein